MCIYRAPDGCMKTFLDHLEILLNTLKCTDKPVIICGDFNINFMNNGSLISEFKSLIHSFNLVDTINTPTRVTYMSQTCLDQIIVNADMFPYNTENINIGISDHNATFLHVETVSLHKTKNNQSFRYNRVYSEENIKYFNYMLEKETWIDVTSKSDVQSKSLEFMNIITHYFNIAFPIKKFVTSLNQHSKQKTG